ncbi:LuxR C-terminal-related transcriptional regulator [Streptomyces mirabilis]|uniref:LuxR C-terminal-related transcriptional regulator n=1 Tax=Streptomyces mirabilis TaxID=68239 RepID=UPI0036DE09FA
MPARLIGSTRLRRREPIRHCLPHAGTGIISHRGQRNVKRLLQEWPFIGREEVVRDFDAALDNPDCRAFVITGEQGIGKTRIAEECRRRAQNHGYSSGTAAVSSPEAPPFTPLAHILPCTFQASQPIQSFKSILHALGQTVAKPSGDHQRYVLLVDDMALLDTASVSLIDQLLKAEAVFLITTLEQEREINPITSSIIYNDAAWRVKVGPLEKREVDTILTQLLGAAVEPKALEELYKVSEGKILYLRELLIGSLGAQEVVFDGELWQIGIEHASTPVLADLVRVRMSRLEERSCEFLKILSLCHGVSSLGYEREAHELEQSGLVVARRAGRREHVELAHPIYGEVLRAQMTSYEERDLLAKRIDLIKRAGARRKGDLQSIASWKLTANGTAEASELIKGALIATGSHDYAMVHTLASAALGADGGYWPRLLMAVALYELGNPEQAFQLLKEAFFRAESDDQRVQVSLMITRLMIWGFAETSEALELNTGAMSKVHTPEARAALKAARGVMLFVAGEPREAIASLTGIAEVPNIFIRSIGLAAYAASSIATGQTVKGLEISQKAYAERLNISEEAVLPHPAQYMWSITFALEEAGHLQEAYARGLQAWQSAVSDNEPEAMAWTASQLSRCALLQGHPVTARRWAAQAAAIARRHSWKLSRHQALVRVAEAAALLQDIDSARKALSRADGLPCTGPFRSEMCLGKVWLEAALGNLEEARSILIRAANAAHEDGHLASEFRLLTDLCRLGGSKAATDRIGKLSEISDGALSKVRARYSFAVLRESPDELLEASRELGDAGADLLAAESAYAAYVALMRRGDSRRGAMMKNIASSFAEKCQGARTPGILSSTVPILTKRETEIAMLVSQGLSTAEVAERLVISRRTVDNHLQNIYNKLGITSRRSLRTALGCMGHNESH